MKEQNKILLFENSQVRTHWDNEQEKLQFSIIDVVNILTYQPNTQGASERDQTKTNEWTNRGINYEKRFNKFYY